MKRLLLTLGLMLAPIASAAQDAPAPTPTPSAGGDGQGGLVVDVEGGQGAGGQLGIAVPVMPAAGAASTAAGPTDALGRQLSDIVTNDLRNSGLFKPLPKGQLLPVSFPEVTSPNYGGWTSAGAQALVQGYVRANGDGTLTVGCYLYDVAQGRELTRLGFVVPPSEWRRAAHKCADMVYSRLSGESGYFDSTVLYVAESGPKGKRVKRIAIMDQDGAAGRFLTNGQSIALTPRLSPDQRQIVYMSYVGNRPAIYLLDIASGRQRKLVENANLTFAPRWSPDGRRILFSQAQNGNTDLYVIATGGGGQKRLTDSPGIDTGGSYSPDGGKIVFESDRSGTQQLYVMNADGSNQQRISFGAGRYATPSWSPRGDLIAFTRIGGGFHIGVMGPGGGSERMLTNGWQDEGPSWAPNGRVIMFFRSTQGGSGVADLWSVDLTGSNERRLPTPIDGSDPSWGPLRP